MIDSVTSQPFSATTLPPIELPAIKYVKEIIESSRQKHAHPRAEVEKAIIDWHTPVDPKVRPDKERMMVPKAMPKPIDTRSLVRETKPTSPPPTPKISLEELKKKNDNQRKPDVKNVSALREALNAVVGSKEQVVRAEKPVPTPSPKPIATKDGPNPEELKKLLGIE